MKKFKTAAVFGDNMVLQREKRICIFGNSEPEIKITAALNNIYAECKADKKGKWQLYLPAMKAGGPYEMNITDGNNTINFNNIMIGEVWLAAGQSNMQFQLCNCSTSNEAEKEINEKKYNMRCYTVPKQSYFSEDFEKNEENSRWIKAGEKEFNNFSAVAYYAAKQLCETFPDITIGIIGCYWGGTSASDWLDRQTLSNSHNLREYIDDYEKETASQDMMQYIEEYNDFTEYNKIWFEKLDKLYASDNEMTWDKATEILGPHRWCPPLGPYSPFCPSNLFNTMLMRICPYTIKGFWYYQGESDDHKPHIYYELFTALINKWRELWGENRLPFIFVQLPAYNGDKTETDKSWACIREAQQKVFDTVKYTGMAVILDQGDRDNIHPVQKDQTGLRLGLQTLKIAYGLPVAADGPFFSYFTAEGNKAVIYFENNEGLNFKDKITGFELAGQDMIFFKAKAQISCGTVIISSEKVTRPEYIRYCFENYPEPSLFGKNGIPLAAFRTDKI